MNQDGRSAGGPAPEEKAAPLLLYKYRALEPWDYFLDILVNERLYAAPFTALNDPMEGVFTYSEDDASPSFVEQMRDRKADFRICSLSESHDNTLMWTYYAAAHQGVVLGLRVQESPDVVAIERIRYDNDPVFRGHLESDAGVEARRVLARKLTAWRHEKEVRVFAQSAFVAVRLESVHLGCRMAPERRALVEKLVRRTQPNVVVRSVSGADLDKLLT